MQWRLITDEGNDAFTNMAIDRAIMTVSKVPAVRLYTWKPAAVSIGCFQKLDDEVDIEKCKEFGMDYVRRITGGGAVFHDAELTYSISIDEKNDFIDKDLKMSYKQICEALILGLSKLGLKADYVVLNDIAVNGKKISGCAQTRRNKKILQHGTLLLDVDADRMFEILKVPNEKMKGKMIAHIKERVTSINKELGRKITLDELRHAIAAGFEEKFKITLVKSELSEEEKKLAEEFKKEFKSKEWTYSR